jgi:catechol 2,3-dioxygenase-like lactoylglutathione lyase family enzyme
MSPANIVSGEVRGNRGLAGHASRAHSRAMRLGQLSEAAIYTGNLDAAKRFYHDVLGLEIISSMESRGISFRCGETVLLVFDPERTRVPDAGVPTHGAIGEGHIAFVVDDSELDQWRTRLMEKGIAIEAEVAWPSGGRSLYFRDPARNVVEFAPPTLWRTKDGRINP